MNQQRIHEVRVRCDIVGIIIVYRIFIGYLNISSLFYENMHSNGLRDPGGKAVAPGTASYFIGWGDRHQGLAQTLQRHG